MKLSVKQLRDNIGLLLAGAWLDSPSDNADVLETLTLSGWIAGKTQAVQAVVVSGAAVIEIPVALHRPDVLAKLGDTGIYPSIEGVDRCGFYQKIAIDGVAANASYDIKALFTDGTEVLIAVIDVLEDNVETAVEAEATAIEPEEVAVEVKKIAPTVAATPVSPAKPKTVARPAKNKKKRRR